MSTKIDALKDLAAARDQARVRIHLLSMEAKERWKELETTLDSLEQRIDQGGEKATEALFAKVRGVTQTVTDFLKSHEPATELSAPVSSIMSHTVASCSATDTLARAAQILWDENCGAVPVIDSDAMLIGIITDRDICMAAYTRGTTLSDLTVESAMSPRVYACAPEDPLARPLDIMGKQQVRRVPVTSHGKLVGVVGLADLARWAHALRVGRPAACEAIVTALAAISESRKEPQGPASGAD